MIQILRATFIVAFSIAMTGCMVVLPADGGTTNPVSTQQPVVTTASQPEPPPPVHQSKQPKIKQSSLNCDTTTHRLVKGKCVKRKKPRCNLKRYRIVNGECVKRHSKKTKRKNIFGE